MKSFAGKLEMVVYIIAAMSFVAAVIYMICYITLDRAPLIPGDGVSLITEWTYIDELTGPKEVTTPVLVDDSGRNTYVFESHMPATVPEGSVIAFLNKADLKVEINGRTVKEWKRTDAPIIGGPPKNSYFVIPVSTSDAGADIRITLTGDGFTGKFFDVFVGEKYEVVRQLEIKNGAFQFAFSLALLVCSFAITFAGVILKFVYKQDIKLILMSIGIFIVSAWMVADSFVFQFVFRTQFIDGFMTYIATLCIVFPFIAYLDAIQDYRYKKWYSMLLALGLANLLVFTALDILKILSFFDSLLY